MRIILNIR